MAAAVLIRHEENLPGNTAKRGQQSQALERKLPRILLESLDAAIPEAATENLCLHFSIVEPVSSSSR